MTMLAMRELVHWRFARGLKEQGSRVKLCFAKMPQLVLIDGGKAVVECSQRGTEGAGALSDVFSASWERFEECLRGREEGSIPIPNDSQGSISCSTWG